MDALRNTAPDECEKRDDALGHCYKDDRCNIPPAMREQCPYVNRVKGNWTMTDVKVTQNAVLIQILDHMDINVIKNPAMFNAVSADKKYSNSLLSKSGNIQI